MPTDPRGPDYAKYIPKKMLVMTVARDVRRISLKAK
jgi:hypothetical protein